MNKINITALTYCHVSYHCDKYQR